MGSGKKLSDDPYVFYGVEFATVFSYTIVSLVRFLRQFNFFVPFFVSLVWICS